MLKKVDIWWTCTCSSSQNLALIRLTDSEKTGFTGGRTTGGRTTAAA